MLKVAVNALFAAFVVLIAAQSADADTLSVVSGLSQTYLSQSSTISGNFDINSATASLGYSIPMNIVGGSITFNFSDNSDPLSYTQSSGYRLLNTICGTGGGPFSICVPVGNYYLEQNVATYYDPIERVTVN